MSDGAPIKVRRSVYITKRLSGSASPRRELDEGGFVRRLQRWRLRRAQKQLADAVRQRNESPFRSSRRVQLQRRVTRLKRSVLALEGGSTGYQALAVLHRWATARVGT